MAQPVVDAALRPGGLVLAAFALGGNPGDGVKAFAVLAVVGAALALGGRSGPCAGSAGPGATSAGR